MKRGWGVVMVAMMMAAFITPAITGARFTSSTGSLDATIEAGRFSPGIPPVPAVGLEGSSARLRWAPISFSGTSELTYRVQRTASDGVTSDVCVGATAPTQENDEVSCVDSSLQVGLSYIYAIQPALSRDGVATWSLPLGAASSSIALPTLTFAGAGPIISTTTPGFVTVPYPQGVEVGDLLILVVVNGRNRSPKQVANWAPVSSRGIGGQQDFHLYTAHHIADGGSSVAVDIDAGVEGASLQVFHYDVPAVAGTPIPRVTQAQSGVSQTATAQLVPSPDIITSSFATAVSIVAIRASNQISLLAGSNWMLRSVAASSPGSTPLAWAIADTSVGEATTIPSPTWEQSGSPARWIFGGSAFG